MRRKLIAAVGAMSFAAAAWGQMGGGMMGGYGGGGRGMGPGMMGGYGNSARGMGPGTPGNYGRPGSADGGYVPGYDSRHGSLTDDGGRRDVDRADLTDGQRARIDSILKESARERDELEKGIRAQEQRLDALYASGDDAAARKAYRALAESRRQLFEESLDARRRIDAVVNSY
jgi:hypothetical protein